MTDATRDVTGAVSARAKALAFLRERWDLVALVVLALAPLVMPALGGALGGQVTTLFIYCILALGLNVMVGYTGLVHLGIAAFFGIGAYCYAILTVPMYPFQMRFVFAAVISAVAAAAVGLALGAPTLRLRGDYLAIVTLGFGEVVKVTLRNLEQITGGMKGLNPVPPPGAGVRLGGTDLGLAFAIDPRWFYYLALVVLAGVVVAMRRLENCWRRSSFRPSRCRRRSPAWPAASTRRAFPRRPTPTPTTSTARSWCCAR